MVEAWSSDRAAACEKAGIDVNTRGQVEETDSNTCPPVEQEVRVAGREGEREEGR